MPSPPAGPTDDPLLRATVDQFEAHVRLINWLFDHLPPPAANEGVALVRDLLDKSDALAEMPKRRRDARVIPVTPPRG